MVSKQQCRSSKLVCRLNAKYMYCYRRSTRQSTEEIDQRGTLCRGVFPSKLFELTLHSASFFRSPSSPNLVLQAQLTLMTQTNFYPTPLLLQAHVGTLCVCVGVGGGGVCAEIKGTQTGDNSQCGPPLPHDRVVTNSSTHLCICAKLEPVSSWLSIISGTSSMFSWLCR